MMHCDPGIKQITSEGNIIQINISLIFQFGGMEGKNMEISLVRLVHKDVSDNAIFFCSKTLPNGTCLSTDNYSERITYTGQRSPWTNITVGINNSVVNDSGTYEVELRASYTITSFVTAQTLFSSISISVTKGI